MNSSGDFIDFKQCEAKLIRSLNLEIDFETLMIVMNNITIIACKLLFASF